MESKKFRFLLSHHLGMGDHIILNGLVRHIYEREKDCEFWLLCYERNAKNVRTMYADLDIHLLTVKDDDSDIEKTIHEFNPDKYEDLHLNETGHSLYADIGDFAFFDTFGYDRKLLNAFKLFRPEREEKSIISNYALPESFAFVHDDRERGYEIDKNRIGLPIISVPKSVPLFDCLPLMKKAKEVHVISSAFLCLCIVREDLRNKTTAHLYVRNPYLKNYLEMVGIKTLV